MGVRSPRVTKQRVLGGATFFVAAFAVMYLLGADVRSLGLGVAVGFALIGAIAVLLWALELRSGKAFRRE